MNGFKINLNEEQAERIIKGLIEKGGYCPCKIPKIPENICPCDEFINDKICHCNLWVTEDK